MKVCLLALSSNIIKCSLLTLFLLSAFQVKGQERSEQKEHLHYRIERQITLGNGKNPFWLNANKYGLSSTKGSNGYLRTGLFGKTSFNENNDWMFRYAADVAIAYNFSSTFIIQQLYGDLSYKKFHLTLGSKERSANLKNDELSSGSQTFGINARPIPELRIETAEYLDLLPYGHWLGMKFEFGYGVTTDARWQKHFVSKGKRYTDYTFYHTQSGFIHIGDENRFPLTLKGGVEWACQFGGTINNINYGNMKNLKMDQRLKNFIQAIYGGGSDPTDEGYDNAGGNTLGSWLFSASYKLPDAAKVRLYYDHYFEDQSQLFMEYGWKDGLYGFELTLPTNRFVSSVVYEYLHTTDQSGPIYHDHTTAVNDQISGSDNYYNHGIYTGWQHWGMSIGNPLYLSPVNNKDHLLTFKNNRFIGHHLGFCGEPSRELHYRILYTYTTNLGTYSQPYEYKIHSTSFLAEICYSPHCLGRWSSEGNTIRLGFGFDRGHLIGNHTGIQLTFCSKGLLQL